MCSNGDLNSFSRFAFDGNLLLLSPSCLFSLHTNFFCFKWSSVNWKQVWNNETNWWTERRSNCCCCCWSNWTVRCMNQKKRPVRGNKIKYSIHSLFSSLNCSKGMTWPVTVCQVLINWANEYEEERKKIRKNSEFKNCLSSSSSFSPLILCICMCVWMMIEKKKTEHKFFFQFHQITTLLSSLHLLISGVEIERRERENSARRCDSRKKRVVEMKRL